jgi:hypothetical protein
MSKTTQIVLGVVAAVVVIGGIWWAVASNNSGQGAGLGYNSSSTSTSNSTSTNVVSETSTSTASSTALPQGSSDQSINQEMMSVNTQMNGLSSDSANVDQSINDQPVQQAQ